MQYKKFLKYLLLLIVFIAINILLNYLSIFKKNVTIVDKVDSLKQKYSTQETLVRALEYCSANTSFEVRSRSRLLSVFVIIRHGDRSPLTLLKDFHYSLNCSMDWTTEYADKRKFFMIIVRKMAKTLSLQDSLDTLYDRDCRQSQLTPEGIKQNIDLGVLLRHKYFDKLGFAIADDVTPDRVEIYSTRTQRTVFSGAALLTGFFHGTHFKTPVTLTPRYSLCDQSIATCKCKIMGKYQRQVAQIVNRGLNTAHGKSIMTYFSDFFGKRLHINYFIEMFMSLVCHNRTACFNKLCIDDNYIDKIWKLEDEIGQQLAFSAAYSKMSRLMMYPWLKQFVLKLKTIVSGSSHTRFTLYSAHDHTIRYLLSALGIYNGHWPSYAANIVFGLTKRGLGNYGFYILYNGKDLTKQLDFCNSHNNDNYEAEGDCDLPKLFSHIERFFFDIFDTNFSGQSSLENYDEICS